MDQDLINKQQEIVTQDLPKGAHEPLSPDEANVSFDDISGIEVSEDLSPYVVGDNKNSTDKNEIEDKNDAATIAKREKRNLERQRRQERQRKLVEDSVSESRRLALENEMFRQKQDKLALEVEHLKRLATQFESSTLDKQINENEQLIRYYKDQKTKSQALADFATAAQFEDLLESEREKSYNLKIMKHQAQLNWSQQVPQQPNVTQDVNTQRYYAEFQVKNDWYGNSEYSQETQLVKAIDAQVAKEGYAMNTKAYWDQLNKRTREALPELYDDENDTPATNIKRTTVGGSSTMSTTNSRQPASVKMHFEPHQKLALIHEGWLSEDGKILNLDKIKQRYKEYNRNKEQK